MKRPGDKNVRCTILLLLDYQPLQFKLDQRLARLLGVHTQTRPVIISALWQYIKTHKLQDTHEREYVNCDPFLRQIFQAERMKFAEIPQRLNPLLHPPDPIVSPMQKKIRLMHLLETVEKCINFRSSITSSPLKAKHLNRRRQHAMTSTLKSTIL